MTSDDRSEIAFFDVETNVPTPTDQGRLVILEFGAILVCPKKLVELRDYSYSSLVRPADLSYIYSLSRRSSITKEALFQAPTFDRIADEVYDLLHGRIWAGHNISRFDCARIREAFAEIERPPPEHKGIIDSLTLLKRFGTRAGNMQMATLAKYLGLGRQPHRSLDDVRMNLEVLKSCATVLFLESSLPDLFTDTNGCIEEFLEPEEVSLDSISAPLVTFYPGPPRIQIWHECFPLQLVCENLKVRFGINAKYSFPLSIVMDAPRSLQMILDKIDDLAQEEFLESGSFSEWLPMVTRKPRFFPNVRLKLPSVADGDMIKWETEIYKEDASATNMIVRSRFDVVESIFTPGNLVDAYFSLDSYDYQQNAGIRLVAKKLIIHSSAANALSDNYMQ